MISYDHTGVGIESKWSQSQLSSSSTCRLLSLRFFTGLALQQEHKASADAEKEAALFLQQGLEHFVSQRCSKRFACVCVCVCGGGGCIQRECEGMTVPVMYQEDCDCELTVLVH